MIVIDLGGPEDWDAKLEIALWEIDDCVFVLKFFGICNHFGTGNFDFNAI